LHASRDRIPEELKLRCSAHSLPPRITSLMLPIFDERLTGANATKETRDAWAQEAFPGLQLVWAWIVLLHFAALIHVDPVIVHWLQLLMTRVADTARPVVTIQDQQHF
jgi:hypothetical protein